MPILCFLTIFLRAIFTLTLSAHALIKGLNHFVYKPFHARVKVVHTVLGGITYGIRISTTQFFYLFSPRYGATCR
jgi:hypothetical protein